MKSIFLLLIGATYFYSVNAQSVNNTTDGLVNILAPHSIVGVSTNEGLVTASYFWYGDSSIFCRDSLRPYAGLKPILGTQLQAKNESGIAAIFNKGDYSPTGKIGFTFGGTFNNYQRILDSIDFIKIDRIQKQLDENRKKFKEIVFKEIDSFAIRNKGKIDTTKIALFKKALEFQLADFDNKAQKYLLANEDDKLLKEGVDELVLRIQDLESEYKLKEKDIEEEIEKQDVFIKRKYHRFAFFGNFSMQALSFKQYEARDTLVLSNNFSDKNFYGIDLRLGFNYNLDVRWMFGTTFGFRNANTFETLTGKEYTLTTSSTSGNTTLKTEKKLTGYSGKYGEFNQFTCNVDVVWFLYDMDQSVQKKAAQMGSNDFGTSYTRNVRNIFGINPYFALKNSLDKTVFPNVMTAGINVFTFKPDGKYNVGFFVELYDIENNVAKMVPDANLRDNNQRLSFGIVTKLALGSMFSPAF